MLRELARSDLAAVDVPHRVDRHALRGARALHLERIRDAVEDLAARSLADADAALPARVGRDAVRLGVGDVHPAIPQRDAARPPVLLPLGDEVSLRVDNLYPVVAAVGDEEPPLRIHREVVRSLELRRSGSELAERS